MTNLGILQIQQKREKFKEEIRKLCKQYEFYNNFHFTKGLGAAISHLITKIEGKEYVCGVVDSTIIEHGEDVFVKPDYPPMDLYLLDGAGINDMNRKYGHHVKKTIPEEKIRYFVLIEKSKLESINHKFIDKSHIESVLKKEAQVYAEYFGVIDIQLFAKYPYLHKFFHLLNEWRLKTGKPTLDQDVIDESVDNVLELLDENITGSKVMNKTGKNYRG